jgi:hypothetical protein
MTENNSTQTAQRDYKITYVVHNYQQLLVTGEMELPDCDETIEESCATFQASLETLTNDDLNKLYNFVLLVNSLSA